MDSKRPVRFAFLDHPGPLAIAHRGGGESHPENTMAAFEDAVGLGYRYVETDILATRDERLVAFHDPTLDRMTDRRGRIEQLDWSEVKAARVAEQGRIPLLDDILGTWPDLRLVIDPKSDRAIEPLIDLIRRHRAVRRVCIGSFSDLRLERLRSALGPELCTSLGPRGVTRLRLASFGLPIGRFVEGAAQVPLKHHGIPIVDARFLRTAHRLGLQVHVWTINEREQMQRLLDLGVDGLVTDRTRVLRDVLVQRGVWA